jgi:hypothetical protein
VVIMAGRTPEKVMTEFKARATRVLRESGLASPDTTLWTRHGSTRHLHTHASRIRAVQYVMEAQ